jgi:hypothetical protein
MDEEKKRLEKLEPIILWTAEAVGLLLAGQKSQPGQVRLERKSEFAKKRRGKVRALRRYLADQYPARESQVPECEEPAANKADRDRLLDRLEDAQQQLIKTRDILQEFYAKSHSGASSYSATVQALGCVNELLTTFRAELYGK